VWPEPGCGIVYELAMPWTSVPLAAASFCKPPSDRWSSSVPGMKAALAGYGVPPERIHIEIFNGSESKSPGVVGAVKRNPHAPLGDSNTGSLVSFARSGIAAHWNASVYQSILELAEACDVPVRWACRSGVCHSCESGLISGTVAYEPEPLDSSAEGNILVCCSQPIRDVVIDL
jgi:ferredoxin